MTDCKISARTRRQAMDWGLVLMSQGIESTIERPEEDSGWWLLVSESEYERAVQTIQQYRHENRGWPWQQELHGAPLRFDWLALGWVVLAGFFFLLGEHVDLVSNGAMDAQAVSVGQWWRLFTAVWLHADIAHLAGNAALGVVLLGLAM